MKKTSGKRLLKSLRHYRITHLAENYGFDAYDLTVYAGWTFKTGIACALAFLEEMFTCCVYSSIFK